MTRTYKIAEHLPQAAREAAAKAIYDHCRDPQLRYRFPCTDEGKCPLGVALTAAGFSIDIEAPPAREVASCLRANGDTTPYATLYHRAYSFINAWDWGSITNVATALGLPATAAGREEGRA